MRGISKKKIWLRMLQIVTIAIICLVAVKQDVSAATKNVTLKNGKAYNANWSGYNNTTYHKVVIPAEGYIKVVGWGRSAYSSNKYGMYTQLLDSKKKALDGKYTLISAYTTPAYTTYYGVKKGTYYIKLTNESLYTLKYTYTKQKDQSGASKAKATKLAKNVYKNGLAIAGEKGNKADWFKFTLPKAQKVTLTFGSRSNKYLQCELISGIPGYTLYGGRAYAKNGKDTIKSSTTLRKGTYYVKVSRMSNDKQASGNYYLKWK